MPVRRRKKPPDPLNFSLQSFCCKPHDYTSDLHLPLHVFFPQPLDLGLRCVLLSESGRPIGRSTVKVPADFGDFGDYLFVRSWKTTNSIPKSRSGSLSCCPVWLASPNPTFRVPCLRPQGHRGHSPIHH
uniref:Uncharacterized protein n=1 Tax=Opuntia streptacantha TaxID=393608 RepID=A0A7C9ETX7_OPUST